MSERQHHDGGAAVASPSVNATQRYETSAARLEALQQRARTLQQKSPFELSDAEADEVVRLERQIAGMQELLPSLQAAARQERATVDVASLESDWQPLMEAKQQAYDALSQKIRAVWDQMAALEAIHAQQEALLDAIPDETVRRYMLSTFWVGAGEMRSRAANNLFPGLAWTDFFTNPLGYRVGAGASISVNDPGVSPIPAAVVANVQSGQLFAEKAHRPEESYR